MTFNPQDYVTEYISVGEVLEIKKGFDLFDRDLGGAIDPKCHHTSMQNWRLLLILLELRLKLKLPIKWLLGWTRTEVARSNFQSSSTWWPQGHLPTRAEWRYIVFSLPLMYAKLVKMTLFRIYRIEGSKKGGQRSRRTYWWYNASVNDREGWYWWRWRYFRGRVLLPYS